LPLLKNLGTYFPIFLPWIKTLENTFKSFFSKAKLEFGGTGVKKSHEGGKRNF
jgi:hypothetical protein